jgi:hypothetical protein
MLKRISGGSSETVLKELTVAARYDASAATAVTIATPVGNNPNMSRR